MELKVTPRFLLVLLPRLPVYPLHAETLTLASEQRYTSPPEVEQKKPSCARNLAKREIYVLTYSFTSVPIHAALAKAHVRGLRVLVVLDKSQLTAKGGKLQSLRETGIPVLIDSKHAIAHNKVMIIDKRKVITGSFSFTKSAEERNAENLLIIHSRSLSKKYMQDFERHMKHAQHLAQKHPHSAVIEGCLP